MASVHREIVIARPPADVWDALADVGALHTRLAPGFVTDCRLEPGARVVTFANGMVARELIVDVDPERRRVAWSVVGGRLSHHNASAQVFAEGERREPLRLDRRLPARRARAGDRGDDRARPRGDEATTSTSVKVCPPRSIGRARRPGDADLAIAASHRLAATGAVASQRRDRARCGSVRSGGRAADGRSAVASFRIARACRRRPRFRRPAGSRVEVGLAARARRRRRPPRRRPGHAQARLHARLGRARRYRRLGAAARRIAASARRGNGDTAIVVKRRFAVDDDERLRARRRGDAAELAARPRHRQRQARLGAERDLQRRLRRLAHRSQRGSDPTRRDRCRDRAHALLAAASLSRSLDEHWGVVGEVSGTAQHGAEQRASCWSRRATASRNASCSMPARRERCAPARRPGRRSPASPGSPRAFSERPLVGYARGHVGCQRRRAPRSTQETRTPWQRMARRRRTRSRRRCTSASKAR